MFAIRMLEEGGEAAGGIGWMVWIALGVFLLMVFLGWLVSSKGWLKKEEEPVHASHDEHGHDDHGHAEHGHEESVHAAAAPAHPDNLVSLEGIGPKVAKVLEGIGITTFAQLAEADAAKVQEALNAAGYKYMDPAGWIEQAKFAAKGDAEGLAKLQGELKGGRKA
jgi:small subunit ribosomal protein S2